ncbi:NADH-ubiquinone oxidoreductase-F iron-sulfur binding region domain-containing protein [Piscinibacter sp. XHJ-5]|uniref:NADH-ubiquinone oxidoreductase-F iron-sulfur binding region domain-containing protein n=1 Tax=Piscinibacter sp. XHJ-5 TaxID=3037797 RepID=UPI002452FB71|nr:NADH-ubiquinone oxidoreductase-F iron-sulfur binding region domain-containing protein [Piscinibacter sp. XHJ-5]
MNAVIPIRSVATPKRRPRMRAPEVSAEALAAVQSCLGELPLRRDLLIELLHAVNDRFGQLRTDHLAALAQLLKLAPSQVYEVASFYHHFEVVREADGAFPAPPRLTVRVCDGLACEMAGAAELLQQLPRILAADVRVIAAPCIGRCEQAPAVAVQHFPLAGASVKSVVEAVEQGLRHPEPADAIDRAAYVAGGGYRLLQACVEGAKPLGEVLAQLEQSGLRGLGGAGFPAGRKWRIVRDQPGPRLMAVNIDEGEPGTFKDRTYLERDPHRFLEGMLIAAWAVGIEAIYIYLRDEYHGCRALLERELAGLRADPPAAGLPRIELRRGAGAYICGEESAMIESIEGRRGMPRLRPPYVAQVGLFGRPTLEHNFETLYWVRDIVERGADWFAGHGRHGRKGLRSFSVSGRVKVPGVHLAPAGITVRELIDEFCGGMLEGHELRAYLPGGASGGILPARLADVPLDFDTLQPHGCFIGSAAVIVLSQHDDILDAARNLMRFFEHESCGQCTPCRSGTAKVNELIATDRWDTALLGELSQVMRDASICGLGQAAPNPIDCVIRYFPEELSR